MNPLIHTNPGEKIVTFFSTRNLYDVLPAAYNSLLAYNPNVHVYCFIEDDKLPYKSKAKLALGNEWQKKAGTDKYKYYMVFENNSIPGSKSVDELLNILEKL